MKQIPSSWTMAPIGDLCDLKNGRAFKPTEWSTEGFPIVRIQNLNNKDAPFNYYSGDYEEKYFLKGGELLFAWSGTPGTSFGAHEWRGGEALLNQHIFRVDFDKNFLDRRLFRHAINQQLSLLISKAHGGAGLQHVTKGKFEATEIAVPPLNEQRRIADKLDTTLARVDALNDRLARITPLLKRFRQSVLAAATSGRLTEDWRASNLKVDAKNYKSIEVPNPYSHLVFGAASWKSLRFDEAINLIGGSQPPKSVFSDVDKPGYIRLIQIRDYKSDKHITFIPRELARKFCSKTDVMIGRYGPPIFQILRGLDGAYNVALMKAVPVGDILINDYLYYFLQNFNLLKYVEAGSDRTAGQDGVNKDHLNKYPVFVPSIQEQTEIVRRVETLFAFADRLEAHLQSAQTAAERLTPALLAKAFRGELVPQDPNDEPAAELLRRLRAARAADTASKPKRGRAAKASTVSE